MFASEMKAAAQSPTSAPAQPGTSRFLPSPRAPRCAPPSRSARPVVRLASRKLAPRVFGRKAPPHARETLLLILIWHRENSFADWNLVLGCVVAPNSAGLASDFLIQSVLEAGQAGALANNGSTRGLNAPRTSPLEIEMAMMRRINSERDPILRGRMQEELNAFRTNNGLNTPGVPRDAEFRGSGQPKPAQNFIAPTNPPQPPPFIVPSGYTVRVMPPTTQYPNGYWRLEKPMPQGGAQGIDPSTMKPGPQQNTHIPLPAGWNPGS